MCRPRSTTTTCGRKEGLSATATTAGRTPSCLCAVQSISLFFCNSSQQSVGNETELYLRAGSGMLHFRRVERCGADLPQRWTLQVPCRSEPGARRRRSQQQQQQRRCDEPSRGHCELRRVPTPLINKSLHLCHSSGSHPIKRLICTTGTADRGTPPRRTMTIGESVSSVMPKQDRRGVLELTSRRARGSGGSFNGARCHSSTSSTD